MAKMQAEIDEVLRDRVIRVEDIGKLHYTSGPYKIHRGDNLSHIYPT